MVHKLKEKSKIKKKRRRGIHKLDFPKGRGYSTRIVVYVPSTKAQDIPVSREEFKRRVQETVNYLSKTFGGVTNVKGEGYWIDEKGKTIGEKVVLVESFSPTRKYKEVDKKLGKWLKQKAREWEQWGISFEFESPDKRSSTLYFVKSK